MSQVDPERARGERVDELLDALETVSAAEREDHLARICPDPELRREVLSLLTAEPESRGSLDRFTQRLVAGLAAAPDLVGRRVGAYRLVRPLGRGGMGVVYEAERVDGAFEQRVALKLLTTALAGTEARNRFFAERQILAGLEHPAIAHIVDGGVTEDGTPWFAMEHVEGVPIDVYCDQRRLDIRQRLEIFLQVCDAVEHAHRRLVVHRDLKPANVLVTEDDAPVHPVEHGSPTLPPKGGAGPPFTASKVKLLDFGIAKLLDVDGAGATAPPTRTALRLMTPEYASPEQVRGEPVTTASDVYQLGLLLYELLTGRRPYALQRRAGGEIGRAICEQAPARPSTTFSRTRRLAQSNGASGPTVEAICLARRTSPSRLRRRLRGDLENIVLMALRKEPERRYGSADRLAQDIRRHLGGLPVTARTDTWVYRGRKFLQRHALGVSAAALMFLFAAGMTGFYTARIQSALDRVEAEAAKSEQVSEFLTSLFEGADPREARGTELTARELLDRGVTQVDRELARQPEVQARMLQVLGRTYLELSIHGKSERLFRRSLELYRHRFGPNHPDVAWAVANLGLLRLRLGEHEAARELLEEAAASLEASAGDNAERLADVQRMLGDTYRLLGRQQEAIATLERALAIRSELSGDDSLPAARILPALGASLYEMGELERAEDLFERALAIHERELGADSPEFGHLLHGLATIRLTQGEVEGLEPIYRRSLSILESGYGPAHGRVATALNAFGHFLVVSERADEAVEVLRRAFEIRITTTGSQNPQTAASLVALGDAYLADSRLEEARNSYRRSVALRENGSRNGDFDPVLLYALVGLGRTEAELGDSGAAEQALQAALEAWNQVPDSSRSPQLVPAIFYLGRWLAERQRCAEAVPLLQRGLRGRTDPHASSGSDIAELENLLASCS